MKAPGRNFRHKVAEDFFPGMGAVMQRRNWNKTGIKLE